MRMADQVREHRRAALECGQALLLVSHPAHHGVALVGQLRVGGRQRIESAVREALHKQCREVDRPALLDCAAHDPAQDVAAVLVRRHDAVGDQRRGPAGVVGEDPHCIVAPPSE